jgi:hypothetical protein
LSPRGNLIRPTFNRLEGGKSEAKHPEWLSAMDLEIQALRKNDTWILVPCPASHKVVGCRWIFKTKF